MLKQFLMLAILSLVSLEAFSAEKLKTRYVSLENENEKITKRSPGGAVKVKEAVGEKIYPQPVTFTSSYEKNLYVATVEKVENLLGD